MFDVEDVIKYLTITRLEFGDLFLKAQYNIEIEKESRHSFEGVTQLSDDKKAFREALEFSKRKKGLYNEIVRLIIRKGFDGGNLVALKKGKEYAAELQAVENTERGYISPVDFGLGLVKGATWTGKVVIDGETKGTGVLIGQKRFLTAWHVVQDMYKLEPTGDGNHKYVVHEDSDRVLQIVFEPNITLEEKKRGKKKNVTVNVADKWSEAFCCCHDKELQDSLPENKSELDNFWDYAIIRLDEAPDDERSWAELDSRAVVPDDKANIMVLQYPNGHGLKGDINEITSPEPKDPAIPTIRFLHHSNTDHGSSGGPCFDKDFLLIGIHQGSWPKLNGRVTNRGVPIQGIIRHMEALSNASAALGPSPDEYLVWYTDKKSYAPIIGIDDFQYLILENIKSKKGYILSIQGEKGAGKSFCLQTLFALLNDADHLKILLPAETMAKADGLSVAKLICSLAGSDHVEIESSAGYNTTTAAWLRDEVCMKVVRELDNRRNKRMVWVCISGLNVYEVDGAGTSEFLLLLYECTLQNPWLQFVLDGIRIALPATLQRPAQIYNVQRKTLDHMKSFVHRMLLELRIKPDDIVVDGFADLLFEAYSQRLQTDGATAMFLLQQKAKALFEKFINKVG